MVSGDTWTLVYSFAHTTQTSCQAFMHQPHPHTHTHKHIIISISCSVRDAVIASELRLTAFITLMTIFFSIGLSKSVCVCMCACAFVYV